MWLLTPVVGPRLGLAVGEHSGEAAAGGLQATMLTTAKQLLVFLPGAVAGGTLGWFIIRPVNWALGHFFGGFNWLFDKATQAYGKIVGWGLRFCAIVLLIYVGLIGLTGFAFTRLPTGFIPQQDKGYLIANIQLPDSASQERTAEAIAKIEKIALETPGVDHTVALSGLSFVTNTYSSNYGSMFITLAPFEERRGEKLGGEAILARLRQRLAYEVPEAPRWSSDRRRSAA